MKLQFICSLAFERPGSDRDRLRAEEGRGKGRISAAHPAMADRQLGTQSVLLLWSASKGSGPCCSPAGLHKEKIG